MDNAAVFQVVYPGPDSAVPVEEDLLELWQPVASVEPSLTYGQQPGLIWRANLPEDSYVSANLLSNHSLALRQIALALAATGPLLAQDLQFAARDGRTGQTREGVNFDTRAPGMASGRYGLITQALTYNPESVSFGIQNELAEVAEIVKRFAGSVQRLLGQFILVESLRGGRRTARSRVDWLGDVHTWWSPGSLEPAIADHHRVLAQALATRQEWLRLVTVLTAGAAKIGLAMTAGPFNPVAIWTAWKYIQKVIEQYRSLRLALSPKT